MGESTVSRRVILASGSPRRRELLAMLGHRFEVMASDVDESPRPGESAVELVARLARAKAEVAGATAGTSGAVVVIGADTIVALDGAIIGKPSDPADAATTLRRLSGRDHHVVTGVCLLGPAASSEFVETTVVSFASMSDADIDNYIATGEPMDKAGAYGIQGLGGRFVTSITGSYHNCVGLPIAQLVPRLDAMLSAATAAQ